MDSYFNKAKEEITAWESGGPGWLTEVGNWVLWPAQIAAERLIPPGVEEAADRAIEGLLLGLANASQFTVNTDAIRSGVEERLGPVPDSCEDWQRLKAADEHAQNCWNWNIGYATTEGVATGSVGLPGLIVDIPALFTIAIRVIQEIATCYGYDTESVEEKDYIMHILGTASAGDIKAKVNFVILLKQLEEALLKVAWKKMAADLAAREVSHLSFLAAVKQFGKSLGMNLTKRKALQMVPIIGGLVGGAFNGSYVNDVGRTAYMSYRRRWLADRETKSPPKDSTATDP